jgi:uncharacterized protein (DUF4415 family)
MGKIVRMTAKEIDREFTPVKIKTMLEKAKTHPVDEDEIPFTPEEWWAKAERPNRGRPKKERPKEVVNIAFEHKDLVYLRSTGRGWQTRVREYIEHGITSGLL